ncbi:MAG: hypothetical protein HFI03_15305 [Lachnospiraceae bacterium]|jgi:hypothetical protein|uniref:hypothetical protein n=1 Tax=Romboutsia ilealis TaxID=1115758 RepID=UPI0026F38550|nr:hypothetical protein [Romboutsia ilealis]MCI9201718.1 hypothetical protein [Lachnospiraceae bacterium]
MKIFKKKEKKEWTDFQKRLYIFLEEEDLKLRDEFKEALDNRNIKRAWQILLQRVNILCIREKAGIYYME